MAKGDPAALKSALLAYEGKVNTDDARAQLPAIQARLDQLVRFLFNLMSIKVPGPSGVEYKYVCPIPSPNYPRPQLMSLTSN